MLGQRKILSKKAPPHEWVQTRGRGDVGQGGGGARGPTRGEPRVSTWEKTAPNNRDSALIETLGVRLCTRSMACRSNRTVVGPPLHLPLPPPPPPPQLNLRGSWNTPPPEKLTASLVGYFASQKGGGSLVFARWLTSGPGYPTPPIGWLTGWLNQGVLGPSAVPRLQFDNFFSTPRLHSCYFGLKCIHNSELWSCSVPTKSKKKAGKFPTNIFQVRNLPPPKWPLGPEGWEKLGFF